MYLSFNKSMIMKFDFCYINQKKYTCFNILIFDIHVDIYFNILIFDIHVDIYLMYSQHTRGHRGHACMVVGFTTISTYHY